MNRYESTKRVGFLGIIANLFLLIIKFGIAIFSNSQAIIADAINSFGDIISSLMTYIGNKIAKVPKDEDHNFGHGKAEYIFSMLISIFMIILAIRTIISSITSIVLKEKFIFSYYMIIVCVIVILVKLALYLYTKKLYKTHKDILIKSNMKDHKNDVFLTMGTLLSCILGYFGFYFFDGIIGFVIALYIIISGIGIFIESYKVLMDISLEEDAKQEIIEYIMNHKEIKNVRDFDTVATGYKYIAIITIDLDGNLKTFKSHEIADKLEKSIVKKFRKIYKVIVHVNPINM
ncbi:MAG: cation diffusion facilitator family transporter [Ruminococcus sp.]|nr:cation diffusion facilitator family transporter [Ruminococcus sp.]